jgi:hypothetical protein
MSHGERLKRQGGKSGRRIAGGYDTDSLLSYDGDGRLSDGAVSNTRIYLIRLCFPPLLPLALATLLFTPKRRNPVSPNVGDALRERASSTGALPDLASLLGRACQHSTPDIGQPFALAKQGPRKVPPLGLMVHVSPKWLCTY